MTLLIKKGLWPTGARREAARHNAIYHKGKPTAHIDVDETYTYMRGPPKYKVWCPVCG